MALAVVLLALGWLLIYTAIKNPDGNLADELRKAFRR